MHWVEPPFFPGGLCKHPPSNHHSTQQHGKASHGSVGRAGRSGQGRIKLRTWEAGLCRRSVERRPAGQQGSKEHSLGGSKLAQNPPIPSSSGSALGDSWPGRVVINRRPAGHAMPAPATRRQSTTLHAGPGIRMDVGLVWGLWLWLWLGDRPLSTSCSTPHPTPHPQLPAAMLRRREWVR